MIKAFGPKRSKSLRDNYLPLLMIVAALFFGQIASAQFNDPTKYTRFRYLYGNRTDRMQADTVLVIPTDTAFSKVGIAIIGSTVYAGNGTYWAVIEAKGILFGTGTPEGITTAPVGTLYRRTDGGTNSTLYVKETGTDEFGWIAVGAGGGGSTIYFDTNLFPGAGTSPGDPKTADTTLYIATKSDRDTLIIRIDSVITAITGLPAGKKFINRSGSGEISAVITTDSVKFKRFIQGVNVTITNQGDSALKFDATAAGAEVNSAAFTLIAADTRVVSSDKMIDYILVKPVSDLNALKIGTATNDDEYVYTTKCLGGQWSVMQVSSYIPANTTLYFTGITSSTDFKIITKPLHE